MSEKQNEQKVLEVEETNTSENSTVTKEVEVFLEEIIEKPTTEKVKREPINLIDEQHFLIGERKYKLVSNYREGFNLVKIGERYSEVLSRYDYIVGDWGYEQLRLKGFFKADNRRVHPDQRIDTLEDYLYEYCNFGCAYFVIKQIGGKKEKDTQYRRKKKNNNRGCMDKKKGPVHPKNKKITTKDWTTTQIKVE